jgi:hypothetical protein
MKLTSNQHETLHAIVVGQCTGMFTHAVPSLIKRGLVVEVRGEMPTPMFGSRLTVEWKLTPLGFEVYEQNLMKRHEAKLKRLEEEFNYNLARARGMIHKG